jgi:hypothetical protein
MHDTNDRHEALDPRARDALDWRFADAVANPARTGARMPWRFGSDGDPSARDAACRDRFGALLGRENTAAELEWLRAAKKRPPGVHRGGPVFANHRGVDRQRAAASGTTSCIS